MKFKFVEEIMYMVEADSEEEAVEKMGEEDYTDYEVRREMSNAL